MFETTLPGFFPFDTSCQNQQLETPKPPCVCEILCKKLAWSITHNPSGLPQRKLLGSSYACSWLSMVALVLQLSGLNACRHRPPPPGPGAGVVRVSSPSGSDGMKAWSYLNSCCGFEKGLGFEGREPF